MAEFLTMAEAEDKFGKKGRTNAALTLGIIGTALGAFAGNNGGCGWAKVVNVSTTGTEYVQVTKFDVIHNLQYTDCKGNVRVATESTSTIMETSATSETITTLVPTVTKVIDVIIPNGVSIINQQILDELPTSLPVKGHCAYSVFDVRITPTPAP